MVTSMNTVIVNFRTLGLFRPPEHLHQNSKLVYAHFSISVTFNKVVKNTFSQQFGHSRPQSPSFLLSWVSLQLKPSGSGDENAV